MRYRRFEDLPVWNDAIDLAIRLLRMSQAGRFKGLGDLRSQPERAAISISNNIAEGFERGTNQELITFLYIARGSTGEVRSMLHLVRRLGGLVDADSSVDELVQGTDSISRQLGAWIETLKNSEFKGIRSQDDRTRSAAQAARRGEEFLEKVREAQEQAIRRRRSATGHDSAAE